VLDGLFPEGVITAWGDPLAPAKPLFPEEEALVARAVVKRKLEFAKGRECARTALASLGLRHAPLLAGESREPIWPADVVGSITHTRGFCAAAVARADRYRGIGIDAEPAEALEPEVALRVCEGDALGANAAVTSLEPAVIARLVFCAKEAVYKCQFPLTRTFLGFGDVAVELAEGAFVAVLRVDTPILKKGDEFRGKWLKSAEHLVAGAWLEA
jgi:4'-phosphopantetheinyl transferase EntD